MELLQYGAKPSVYCCFQAEEKCRTIQEKLELSEQKLQQYVQKAEALPDMEAELAQRLEALSQVGVNSLPLTSGLSVV